MHRESWGCTHPCGRDLWHDIELLALIPPSFSSLSPSSLDPSSSGMILPFLTPNSNWNHGSPYFPYFPYIFFFIDIMLDTESNVWVWRWKISSNFFIVFTILRACCVKRQKKIEKWFLFSFIVYFVYLCVLDNLSAMMHILEAMCWVINCRKVYSNIVIWNCL